MSRGWYVTDNDIANWAEHNSRRAQEVLPLLVKRLIFASVSPSLIRFPSGDSITESGWDGILKTDGKNTYVPVGDSAWELSTTKAVRLKANRDYLKRTLSPSGIDRKNSTFILVTSRKWREYNKWIAEKKSENKWANVKVLTCVELADWLEQCPAVHRWFSRLIGNRPDGAWDVEQAWLDWSLATRPQCNTNLVIAGRNRQSSELARLLTIEPDIISISSENKDECYAFILSTIKTHPSLLPRLLVVRDAKEWDELVENNHSLILVPNFNNLPTLGTAISKGHWVLLPSLTQYSKNVQIVLEDPNIEQQIKALVEMGVNEEDAEAIVYKSKSKLHIIRRHEKLAQVGQPKPDWANPENAELLVTLLLAGSWLSDNTNDCEKISYLTNLQYDKVEQLLNIWIRTGDYPVEHSGNKWQIVSYTDAWQFLSPFVSQIILNRFGEAVVDVLTETDPRLELPPTERWLAAAHKKLTKFSSNLRHGLSEGLAILGSFGDRDCKNIGDDSVQNYVSYCVRRLLIEGMSEMRWGSLASELPMLAEASPEIFLQAVELGLDDQKPSVMALFIEEGPMGGCPHCGLLRGLECISWDLNYTSRVVSILAILATKDPGGQWANRPYNTLNEIFRGWLPQTKASLDKRMEILDSLIVYNPNLAWKLLIDLLPEPHEVSSPISVPYFREWLKGWKKGVNSLEYQKHVCGVAERVLEQISKQPEKWLNIEKVFATLPQAYLNRAFDLLEKDAYNLKVDTKTQVYYDLLKIISHNRQFAHTKWAIPNQYIDKLETISLKLTPEDPVSQYKFLFDSPLPPIPHPLPFTNYEENDKRSEQMRLNALEEIWVKKGIDGVKRLVDYAQLPRLIGNSLSQTMFQNKIEKEILNWLENDESFKFQEVARSYVYARSCKGRQDWLDSVYSEYSHYWSEKMWTSFCLGLPFNKVLFEFLNHFSETVKSSYWKSVLFYYLTKEDVMYAQWVVEQLLANNRAFAAVNAAANYLETIAKDSEIKTEVLMQALEQTAKNPEDFKSVRPDLWRYDLEVIIKQVTKDNSIDQSRLAMIEWLYMPLYSDEGIQPKVLINEVMKNPKFFCDLICMMFKADPPIDNEFPDLPDALIEHRALNAKHLIDLIDTIPGQKGTSEVDPKELDEWVKQSKEECALKNRKVIGEEQIGQILSHSPLGKDNIWPHEAVRDIIERYGSHDIEKGIEIGKFNQRGVVTKSLSEGGEQERKIAANLERQANEIKFKFPRTAGILQRMADTYKRQAMHEDRDKDLLNYR